MFFEYLSDMMEVYIDDMLVKSLSTVNYFLHLQ